MKKYTKNRQNVTASALKIHAAKVVAGEIAGQIIGALTRNRIRHQGLWFHTRSADFTPRVRAQMFWGAYEGTETRMIRSFLPVALPSWSSAAAWVSPRPTLPR